MSSRWFIVKIISIWHNVNILGAKTIIRGQKWPLIGDLGGPPRTAPGGSGAQIGHFNGFTLKTPDFGQNRPK